MVYQWKPGSRYKVDPQVAGQRIQDLIEENDGLLEPALIVKDAEPVDSPLHSEFEWDDSVAAKEWREHTARNIVAAIVVVQEQPERKVLPVRAFVNVREDRGRGYTTTARAVSDEELFSQIVDDVIASIRSFEYKLRAFKQYEQMEEAFVGFVKTLKEVKG